jgi:SAM-dependent methyltransferase
VRAYSAFSLVYDTLMEDVDYIGWADYIEKIFEKEHMKPVNMAELACGTGNLTNILANRGYHLLGTDISSDMLFIAREKSIEGSGSITYLQQDMKEMSLPTELDVILCVCDGFNYILDNKDLEDIFAKVKKHLKKDGLFIFDISSHYKLKNILGNNTYAENYDEVSYIWENYYDEEESICDFDLTIFVEEDGLYRKFEEKHSQRAYKIDEIGEILKKAGFSSINVYDGYSFNSPKEESERISFVCR